MTSEKIRVGVMRGGPSNEYEVSLKTGASVLNNIPRESFEPFDIFIDRAGVWYVDGTARSPHAILHNTDVVFNALHGEWGEDGSVQEMLDGLGAKYTGSKAAASRRGMQKALAKTIIAAHGIKTPVWKIVHHSDGDCEKIAAEIYRTFPQPSVIKPVASGSSVGVSIARSARELEDSLARAFSVSDSALIEEYISGAEATVGVIDSFRGEKLYTLFPIEIVPPAEAKFFDYEAKYGGKTEEICPGRFSKEDSAELRGLAAKAHEILGLRHYSRSDFIIHPKRGIYFLEINSLPGLTNESLVPKALRAVGADLPEFLSHIIIRALED
jgi:D-alanine-D-alanine ligase